MVKQEAYEIFDDVMLGDGSLVLGRRYNNAYFSIDLSGKETLGYLLWVKDALLIIDAPVKEYYPKIVKQISRGKPFDCCWLRSGCSPLLTKEHSRWYLNKGKEVPVDTRFTPLSIAHWFMGDGGSSHDEQYTAVNVALSTYGYNERSILILEDALHNLGLSTGRATGRRIVKGSGVILTILQDSVNKFMDIIQPYIVEPYMYKIKYRGTHSAPVKALGRY